MRGSMSFPINNFVSFSYRSVHIIQTDRQTYLFVVFDDFQAADQGLEGGAPGVFPQGVRFVDHDEPDAPEEVEVVAPVAGDGVEFFCVLVVEGCVFVEVCVCV